MTQYYKHQYCWILSGLVVVTGICIPSPPRRSYVWMSNVFFCCVWVISSWIYISWVTNFVWASRFVYLFGTPISALGITLETFWPACRLFCMSHQFVCKNKVMTNKWGSENPKGKKLRKDHHYIYKSTQMSELMHLVCMKKCYCHAIVIEYSLQCLHLWNMQTNDLSQWDCW